MSIESTSQLGAIEREELARHEAVIQRGLATFVEVGQSLGEVREQRLYRETHATFEDYCRERWGLSRSRSYQLMDAAQMVSTIVDTEPTAPVPSTESQARELAGLDPEQAADTMRRAHEATVGQVTAKAIREARTPSPASGPEGEADPERDLQTPSPEVTDWIESDQSVRDARYRAAFSKALAKADDFLAFEPERLRDLADEDLIESVSLFARQVDEFARALNRRELRTIAGGRS